MELILFVRFSTNRHFLIIDLEFYFMNHDPWVSQKPTGLIMKQASHQKNEIHEYTTLVKVEALN